MYKHIENQVYSIIINKKIRGNVNNMKKYTVSKVKIGRKMTRGKIETAKIRNKYVDENKQMTPQQQKKIKWRYGRWIIFIL